jgi:hypothetical protein
MDGRMVCGWIDRGMEEFMHIRSENAKYFNIPAFY